MKNTIKDHLEAASYVLTVIVCVVALMAATIGIAWWLGPIGFVAALGALFICWVIASAYWSALKSVRDNGRTWFV